MNKYYEYKQGPCKIVFLKIYESKKDLNMPECFKKSKLICIDQISIENFSNINYNITIEEESLTSQENIDLKLRCHKAKEIHDFEYNSMVNLIKSQADKTGALFDELKANLRTSE